ncbi:MAG: PIN domain-containing protein [Gemmataceae bacterium]
MKPVLLDTGCIVALLDASERYHQACAAAIAGLAAPLVTCEAVVAESCHLLGRSRGAAAAVLENIEQGVFLVPFRLVDRVKPVRKLLAKYADVRMDLADACLVDLATQVGSGDILTLDRDFQVYRWDKKRPFRMLIELDME